MKQLLVLSGKGGTGKTTVAAAFIRLSQAIGYADCDVDAPNLHLVSKSLPTPERKDFFGMKQAEIQTDRCISCGLCKINCKFNAIGFTHQYEVEPFACEGCGVCEMICPEKAIKMIPSKAGDLMTYKTDKFFSTAQLKMGKGNSGLLVTEVKKALKNAVPDHAFTIVDGSPGIGCPVLASLSGATMTLIVAEPSLSGISDLVRILETAKKMGVQTMVCVNKYDTNKPLTNKIIELCKASHVPFVGKIPYDEYAVMAVNNSMSIVDLDCKAGDAVRGVFEMAMKIFNEAELSNSLFRIE